MAEYELAAYTTSMMSNFLTALTIYFSIVTTYVVAAFVAGARLIKIQLAIVNLCFVIAAGIMGPMSVLIFMRFFSSATRVANGDGSIGPINFTAPLSILIAGVFIGCLVFMWSIRKDRDA